MAKREEGCSDNIFQSRVDVFKQGNNRLNAVNIALKRFLFRADAQANACSIEMTWLIIASKRFLFRAAARPALLYRNEHEKKIN